MTFQRSHSVVLPFLVLWLGCEPGRIERGTDRTSAALTCPPSGAPGTSGFCTVDCPCGHGQGDCNSDAECVAGGRCLDDVGPAYGYAEPDVDVCVTGCPAEGNGASGYCTEACPCGAGEGDCDGNTECLGGLVCARDSGAAHGLDPDIDVCEEAVACTDDGHESNDSPETATLLAFSSVDGDGRSVRATIDMFSAQLCATDGDWYRIPSAALPRLADFDTILIWVFARNAGCSACAPQLPAALGNTVTVEIYDATGTALLGAWTSEVGVVVGVVEADLPGHGGDLLVRVSGPGQAQYGYKLKLDIQNDDEDEEEICEC